MILIKPNNTGKQQI